MMGPGSSLGLGLETDMGTLYKVIPGVLGKPVTVSKDGDDKQDSLLRPGQFKSLITAAFRTVSCDYVAEKEGDF